MRTASKFLSLFLSFVLFLSVITIVGTDACKSKPKIIIAVPEIESTNLTSEQARRVTSVVRSEVSNYGTVRNSSNSGADMIVTGLASRADGIYIITLSVEDLKNGTFSVTNVGSIGGLFSSPIINYPEVGIMGIHKIHKRPVVKDESIVIRDMMYLSFSFDHRIVDGALAAEFAQYLIKRMENPSILFLEMM